MGEPIHIVALGARTPLGFDVASSCAAVRAGITRIDEHPFLVDSAFEPLRMSLDYALDPAVQVQDRFIPLVLSALNEVYGKLEGSLNECRSQIPLWLCVPEERPGWQSADQQHFLGRLRQQPLSRSFSLVQLVAGGHAGGLQALESACRMIRSGQAEIGVIVGVDSYMNTETLAWLDTHRQLATGYHRGAFFPGEGAGAFAVASHRFIEKYRLNSLARVQDVGLGREPHPIKSERICLGEGLTAAIHNAVSGLQLPEQAIEGIICDINGERYRSEEWGFVSLRLPQAMVDPTDYDLPSACWGDVGAASGPLFIMLAVQAGLKKYARGERYLIWNSSESGARAAAVLELNQA